MTSELPVRGGIFYREKNTPAKPAEQPVTASTKTPAPEKTAATRKVKK